MGEKFFFQTIMKYDSGDEKSEMNIENEDYFNDTDDENLSEKERIVLELSCQAFRESDHNYEVARSNIDKILLFFTIIVTALIIIISNFKLEPSNVISLINLHSLIFSSIFTFTGLALNLFAMKSSWLKGTISSPKIYDKLLNSTMEDCFIKVVGHYADATKHNDETTKKYLKQFKRIIFFALTGCMFLFISVFLTLIT